MKTSMKFLISIVLLASVGAQSNNGNTFGSSTSRDVARDGVDFVFGFADEISRNTGLGPQESISIALDIASSAGLVSGDVSKIVRQSIAIANPSGINIARQSSIDPMQIDSQNIPHSDIIGIVRQSDVQNIIIQNGIISSLAEEIIIAIAIANGIVVA